MAGPGPRYPVDHTALADFLRALANASRLELLEQLRFPHTLGELRVSPQKHGPGQNPERPASKPAVLEHLDKLAEADLVHAREVERQGHAVKEYVANPVRLYAALEDLRSIVVRYAGRGLGPDATATVEHATAEERPEGPHFVLVRGLYEGKAFALSRASAREGRWVLGRKVGLPVALDYDPYISLENAEVRERGGRYSISDLDSKNGTWVNWSVLEPGVPRELRSADLVGVGRSMLLFVG